MIQNEIRPTHAIHMHLVIKILLIFSSHVYVWCIYMDTIYCTNFQLFKNFKEYIQLDRTLPSIVTWVSPMQVATADICLIAPMAFPGHTKVISLPSATLVMKGVGIGDGERKEK